MFNTNNHNFQRIEAVGIECYTVRKWGYIELSDLLATYNKIAIQVSMHCVQGESTIE